MIERNGEWVGVACNLNEINQKIKHLNSEKSKLSILLQQLSGDQDSFGGQFEYKKINRLGSINYDLVANLYHIDLDSFRKPSTSFWKISLRNPIIVEDIK